MFRRWNIQTMRGYSGIEKQEFIRSFEQMIILADEYESSIEDEKKQPSISCFKRTGSASFN